MGFLDPKRQEDDDVLPGSDGLRLDLDVRACPVCRREALPWQPRCQDCDVETVHQRDLPARSVALPHLADDEDDAAGSGGDDRADTD